MESQIYRSLVGLKKIEGDKNAEFTAAVAVAEGGLFAHNKKPSESMEERNYSLPKGYTVFMDRSGFFLHFKGTRPTLDGDKAEVDVYYGPFDWISPIYK